MRVCESVRERVYVCKERLVERYERDDEHRNDIEKLKKRHKRKIDN